MHRRLGSVTLSQLAFPGESNLNFPWEKSHWQNTFVKSFQKFKKEVKSKKKKFFFNLPLFSVPLPSA